MKKQNLSLESRHCYMTLYRIRDLVLYEPLDIISANLNLNLNSFSGVADLKTAMTDMRYFAWSKFSSSLVRQKKIDLI